MAASSVSMRGESKKNKSRLITSTALDAKDDLDELLDGCRASLSSLLSGVPPHDFHNVLSSVVCQDMQRHHDVMLGLLSKILVEPENARTAYRDMLLLARDGLSLVVRKVEVITMELYQRLQEQPRTQLVWAVGEMVKSQVIDADRLVLALLKQIEGGNVEPRNVWLAEQLLNLLNDNRPWLEQNSLLLTTAVYTYLRLLTDHNSPSLSNLQQAEIEFCVGLLRSKFMECAVIGRDLVRLLQNVARIGEFQELWRDILQDPLSLSPHFAGVRQLLSQRTSRKFFASRLTTDMETKLNFLTSKVKFGQQKRYQDWFHQQFLSTPESQSLISDLIRYICCVVHPTNEVLASDVVPRWAVVGWLLMACQNNVAASCAKLALFFDWFFYDPHVESIMNIEPAILVMHHSSRQHPTITTTLLDFLCRVMVEFSPVLASEMTSCVHAAFQDILEKRVVSSLHALLENPKLDPELRLNIRDAFSQFCTGLACTDTESGIETNSHDGQNDGSNFMLGVGSMADSEGSSDTYPIEFSDEKGHADICDDGDDFGEIGRFSDDEDSEDRQSNTFARVEMVVGNSNSKSLLQMMTDNMDSNGKSLFDRLQVAESSAERVKTVDDIVHWYSHLPSPSLETAEVTASNLAQCLSTESDTLCSDRDPSQTDELPQSLFRHAVAVSENFGRVIDLLHHLQRFHPSTGYFLLYQLKSAQEARSPCNGFQVYRSFSKTFPEGLLFCLERDLKACQEEDPLTFFSLLSTIFVEFADVAHGSSALIYLVVSSIDSFQLFELVCKLSLRQMKLIGKADLRPVIGCSLEWESFEQFCLWQLIAAEDVPLSGVTSLLSEIDSSSNPEPLTGMLSILRRTMPQLELLISLLQCPAESTDSVAMCVLYHWATEHPQQLAQHFVQLLSNVPRMSGLSIEHIVKHIKLLHKCLPQGNTLLSHPQLLSTFESIAGNVQQRSINLLAGRRIVDNEQVVERRKQPTHIIIDDDDNL